MSMRISFALILTLLIASSLSAHVMVSPPQSKSGATQKYEVRVHNEGKLAATSIALEIPEGITVLEVAKPAAGTFTTAKTGNRITTITWQVDVQPSKYLALPFTAKNPDAATNVQWNVREHLADGSVVEWSDKPGAQEKGSVTKITAASAAATRRPAGSFAGNLPRPKTGAVRVTSRSS
jgi:outer membrane autotransporter protein